MSFSLSISRFHLIVIVFFCIHPIVGQTPFITTWKTDNPGVSGPTQITIPTIPGGTYNYEVDWNNDGVYDDVGVTGDITRTYLMAGTYIVRIRGTFPQIYFNNGGDAQKLLSVDQWGDIQWSSFANAFYGCSNMNVLATDSPELSLVTDLSSCFRNCASLTADLDNWDVSGVTNMSAMFRDCDLFNGDVTTWQTGNVTDMSRLFTNANLFNQPIGNWDVSQVTNMFVMFGGAHAFNQPIGNWNVGQVTNMGSMFVVATSFNQPIGNWNVGQVTNMSEMFNSASSFNQPIGTWNTGQVTNMGGMFILATAFNQPIGNWDVSQVTETWLMFNGATSFNQPIGGWNVSQVQNMYGMFFNATAFDQPIGGWNMGQVTDINAMFNGASSFNQPIGGWDVSQVQDMQVMFLNAVQFDQDLGDWDISNVNSFANMFQGAGLSIPNYDALLIGWSTLDPGETQIPVNKTFDAGSSMYCGGVAARNLLTGTFGWTINDGGERCETWWTGNASNDWFDAANWTNGVPVAGQDAYIPEVGTNPYPVISTLGAVCNYLEIQPGSMVTINTGGELSVGQ